MLSRRTLVLSALVSVTGCTSIIDDQIYQPTTGALKPEDGVSHKPQIVLSTTKDENQVQSWYFPPKAASYPVIAIFHGNSSHAGMTAQRFAPLLDAGYGLFVMDYRGFGDNPGKPSQAGLMADALAQLDTLQKLGVPNQNTILLGHSLGGALAIMVARKLQDAGTRYAGLVTFGAVPSTPDLAPAAAAWLLQDTFDAVSAVKGLQGPKIFIHGTDDTTVPNAIAQKLTAAANVPPSAVILLKGIGHMPDVKNLLPVFEQVINAVQQNQIGALKALSSETVTVNLKLS